MSVYGNLKRQILYAIHKTLTDYNERNNEPLSNVKIREAIHKFMEEESL